ncbi:MAG: Thiosulfate sulfurtransferase [Arenicellales bacterium IbO2]|nr:MAG: Thiosulfate sulfurtransferase [Arenicellales bacterium IbO2]
MHAAPPYLIEPRELERMLPGENLLVVDVGNRDNYLRGHVPCATHLDYGALVSGRPPVPGLLPPLENLQESLRRLGLSRETHVVAYDDQGNGRAARLLWTLATAGHAHMSLLNGGLAAWHNEGHPLERGEVRAAPGDFRVDFQPQVLADKSYVLASLGDPRRVILDARSPQEYRGEKSASPRRGRIPGAVNLNWLDTIDRSRNLRFKPDEELRAMLAERGVARDCEIIVHCQTHHRSSHSFVMLRHLGFNEVRGYAGSWAEWSDDPSLPVENPGET